MTLKVIGVGMGRTGTLSLKRALERVGLGPGYHLTDLIATPQHWPLWQQAIDGRLDRIDSILGDYGSVVDAPGWYFFREWACQNPDARFILTVRDSAAWFASTQATVCSDQVGRMLASVPQALFDIIHAIALRSAGPKMHDRDYMVGWFEGHIVEVQRTIAPEKLLVCEISEGWAPLCGFLGVPVPDEPFPHANRRIGMKDSIRDYLGDAG